MGRGEGHAGAWAAIGIKFPKNRPGCRLSRRRGRIGGGWTDDHRALDRNAVYAFASGIQAKRPSLGFSVLQSDALRWLVAHIPQAHPSLRAGESWFNPTAWFAVLVVFVLAEVFREGARLREEAELTI